MDPNDHIQATTARTHDTAAEEVNHFTGVVVIHGLGDEKRNSTLMEAVNAIAFWFNHHAGLALRPTGPGRVWLSTELTEKDDPDAPASRATIELEAPSVSHDGASGKSPLRLEFREVWWAQSFGIQPLGTTIRWARVQAREQARHILIPVGRRLRRAGSAKNTPSAGDMSAAAAAPTGIRRLRPALRALLAIYGGVQTVWKMIQWLVLTPIVLGLLVLISALQVLSFIGIIRSALVTSFNALSRYVMLHWIASTQVYMRDYALAAEIRERFEREVDTFLADPHCDRVVVIAHSMGTVIAYEGLTTLLSEPKFHSDSKPITFICLAQALRRVWLLPGVDARRLRGVLPARVDWIHFWARYDPIAVGPLSARAFPNGAAWSDAEVPDPSDAIRASLDRCRNVVVANTDSGFTDHITYWTNIEQVVGPIARELVSDHPDLTQVATAHLATRDDVLLRRWDIAWRYTVALAAGTVAGGGVMLWQILQPQLSETIASLLRRTDWLSVLVSIFPFLQSITSLTGLTSLPPNPLQLSSQELSHYSAFWYYFRQRETLVLAVSAALALIAGTAGMQVVGRLVGRSSPFDAPRFAKSKTGGTNWALDFSVGALALAFATSFLFTTFVGTGIAPGQARESPAVMIFSLTLALADLVNGIAFWIAFFDALLNRLWGWCAFLLLALFLCYTFDPYYRSALLSVGIVGCVIAVIGLARERRYAMYWMVGLATIVILYIGLGALAADLGLVRSGSPGTGAYVESILPSFLYGLWAITTSRRGPFPRLATGYRAILGLVVIYLALLYTLYLGYFGSAVFFLPNLGTNPAQSVVHTVAPIGTLALGDARVWVAVFVALLAFALALGDALQSRRWIWLASMPLMLAALGTALVLLRIAVGVAPVLPDDALAFSLAPLATAFIYYLRRGYPRL